MTTQRQKLTMSEEMHCLDIKDGPDIRTRIGGYKNDF